VPHAPDTDRNDRNDRRDDSREGDRDHRRPDEPH
jgi:hypothetical protein